MTYKIVGSPTFSLYFERLLCKKGWCLTDKNQELWTVTWLSDNVPVTVLARGRIGTWAVWVRRDDTEMCNISHLTNVHQIISAACLKAFCECTCINNGISSVWGCFYGWSVVVYCCCFVLFWTLKSTAWPSASEWTFPNELQTIAGSFFSRSSEEWNYFLAVFDWSK